MNLHAVIVLLAVTAGSSLFGIIGAFLAVGIDHGGATDQQGVGLAHARASKGVGSINGRSVQFMVDTGASTVALDTTEAERLVQRGDRLVQLGVLDQHRDSNLGGRDQVDVDADLGQRLAELGGDAGVAAHTGAHQRHLADVIVVQDLRETDLVLE